MGAEVPGYYECSIIPAGSNPFPGHVAGNELPPQGMAAFQLFHQLFADIDIPRQGTVRPGIFIGYSDMEVPGAGIRIPVGSYVRPCIQPGQESDSDSNNEGNRVAQDTLSVAHKNTPCHTLASNSP